MSTLTVNVDMVAALREIGGFGEPDPTQAAVLAELAGADGIAIQLRRNRRFIRDRDLYLLKGVVKTKLTLEIPPADEVIEKALEVKPWMVTFVAEQGDKDGPVSPLDLNSPEVDFSEIVARFKGLGVHVGLFLEPDIDQIKTAAKAGASAVLLSSAGYTGARTIEEAQQELDRIDRAAVAAGKTDMAVHCGRGINYKSVRPLVELGVIDEFVIGFAICARALLVGFERAVREMLQPVQIEPPRS